MADAHYEQGGRLVLGASSPNVMHQCRHPESSHFTNLWFVPVMAGQIDTKMSADSTVQRNLQRHKRCSLLRWPGHHGPPRIQLLEDERVKSDMLEWTPLHMGIRDAASQHAMPWEFCILIILCAFHPGRFYQLKTTIHRLGSRETLTAREHILTLD